MGRVRDEQGVESAKETKDRVMNYEGWVDALSESKIHGWAFDRDNHKEKISTDIIINDRLVATLMACRFREDLKNAGISNGYAAFHFCPDFCLNRGRNSVRIVYSGTDMTLPNGSGVIVRKKRGIKKTIIDKIDKIRRRKSIIDEIQNKNFPCTSKISIIMPVYNVEGIWLKKAIESVREQPYKNWELCIADDASTGGHVEKILRKYSRNDERIKVKFLDKNQGIAGASNEAALMALGEYLAFLDHDDEITTNALYETVKVINLEKSDIIYSDEDIIGGEGRVLSLHFKPDFSPDLLLSHNYVTHFLAVRKSLFFEVGGFSSRFDGAQDYDLILKLAEKTKSIYHIPKVLYHWRLIPTSTSVSPESKPGAVNAGKAALQTALKRRGILGDVVKEDSLGHYRVKRKLLRKPLISIIVPFKDKAQFLRGCIEAILDRSNYQNFEIIGISNNSTKTETLKAMTDLQEADNRIRFYEYDIPFNYPKINNYAVSLTNGEHIVLMNNDIEIITTDWIEALLEHSQREDVGAVGAKLYYPNDTIQHAGVIIGIAGFAGHSHKHYYRKETGFFNRLMCIQNISAVTGALLMVKKGLYEEVGGFDGKNFSVALNDVDFCLKLRERGYLNIFTPYCEAYHHESASRGYEDPPEKKARFKKEIEYFRKRWKDVLVKGDPYYNPNLTLEREDFSVREGLSY